MNDTPRRPDDAVDPTGPRRPDDAVDPTGPQAFRMLFHDRMMERSPEERMRMGSEMRESARDIVLASLPEGLSEEERNYSLFLRFYSRDFDGAARRKIRELMRLRYRRPKQRARPQRNVRGG